MTVDTMPQPVLAGSSSQPTRLLWLDVARGIGIILVVIGHALGGIIDSVLGTGQLEVRQAFFVVYTFHMPLFFMLSGALVARRVERSRGDFAKSLFGDLVWPYFLWSVVQFTLIFALGNLANRPIHSLWGALAALPHTPISQFWFLYALLILHLASIVGLKTLGRTGFLLACFAAKPLAMLVAMPLVFRLAANQAPWYGIGVCLAASGLAALAVDRSVATRALLLPVAAVTAIAVVLAATPTFVPTADIGTAAAPVLAGLAWSPVVFPAGLLGALAVLGIAGFALGPLGPILGFLGRRSMPIFILHIMGIAGGRIILTKIFGMTDLTLILPIIVAMGLALPVVAFEIARRLGWNRWLGLGRA